MLAVQDHAAKQRLRSGYSAHAANLLRFAGEMLHHDDTTFTKNFERSRWKAGSFVVNVVPAR